MPGRRFTVPAVLDQRADECGDRLMMSIDGTPVTFEVRIVDRHGKDVPEGWAAAGG
jgi:hypothetical protein